MTNREWIESLTDQQLAAFLSEIIDCLRCPANEDCNKYTKCETAIEEWLRRETQG